MIPVLWFKRLATEREHAFNISKKGEVAALSLCGRVLLDQCEDEATDKSFYSCVYCKGRQRGDGLS